MSLTFSGIHQQILEDETGEIDVEGARDSGKTWLCCAKVIRSCVKYPGIEWLICRYSNEDVKDKLRPEFLRICAMEGVSVDWNAEESAYLFRPVGGKVSKVFAHGLKSQTKLATYSKIRGLGVACVWNDQTEETPGDIAKELRFSMRQPGYPHQLLFSPNPPDEDHYLADEFPEDNSLRDRRYYCISIYDNAHNLPESTILRAEQAFPKTHGKYKPMILGQRGPNVVGTPVYEDKFQRELHVKPTAYEPSSPLLEGIECGRQHPVWVAAQRNYLGGIVVLGGIIGKRLFLDDFLPLVQKFRSEWFGDKAAFKLCCDPPPSEDGGALRHTNIAILREAKLSPVYRHNANAPDVREAAIQSLAGYMSRRTGRLQAFAMNDDPTRWLMASPIVVKQTKLFTDGVESMYVWDEHLVSIGNKKVRQPKVYEWDGPQRCLENILLNFCAGQETAQERERRELSESNALSQSRGSSPHAWMA